MNEIRINERWGYSKDEYQTILHEHYMTAGGINPKTKKKSEPRETERRTFHPTLRKAVLAAIEKESQPCEDLESLLRLTDRWEEIARQFRG